ncbi:hypothetical protein [Streptomyces sp. NPDC056987]|uniref:hypothetical protein n=1 Tax=Streptomyces sp. NPDC056987 TaxID=3345988 RepID=UPI00362A7716
MRPLLLRPGGLDHEALDASPQRHATAYVRGLLVTAGLVIEHPPSRFPGNFQVEEVHHAELRRCLGDASPLLDVRVVGALVRRYALQLTRIVELSQPARSTTTTATPT